MPVASRCSMILGQWTTLSEHWTAKKQSHTMKTKQRTMSQSTECPEAACPLVLLQSPN